MMKAIGRNLGLAKENIHVQDYKESFCYYMFYQPKELWQYESALFYCDGQEINACMLKKLHVTNAKGKEMFVTVDEVASARIEELEALSAIMSEEKANQKEKVTLFMDDLKKYYQRSATPRDIAADIMKMLESRYKARRNRDAR